MPFIENVAAYIAHAERVAATEGRGGPRSLSAERARLTTAKASIAAIDLREQNNALVRRTEVEAAWGVLINIIRSHLSAVPRQLSARLANVSSIVEAEDVVKAEIYTALEALVSQPIVSKWNGNGAQRSRAD
jgi:phage terminase Nu1 subunit (DNA packaging protein)